jgi:hypothetical protein
MRNAAPPLAPVRTPIGTSPAMLHCNKTGDTR